MDHVAIMKKSWGLLPRILSGQKTIESRWYQSRRLPWGKIAANDVVYFKNSGNPVTVKAVVENVLSFSGLTPEKIKNILNEYAQDIGIEKNKERQFFALCKDKKYCLLIFLKNPERVQPFEIDKTGFGMMSPWLTIENIDKIKR